MITERVCMEKWNTDMPQLSDFDKGRCVGYLEAGKSIRWTAHALNVSKSTVERWWNRYRIEGHVRRREGSGRPRLTSPAQDRKLVVKIKRNRFSPVSRLSGEWVQACGMSISVRTATRRAVMAGLSARRPAQRIPLSPTHKDRRKQWCLEHVSWTSEWDGVLWTDESRFCLDFADGRVRVRRMANERYAAACISEHDRYGGGSVMMWGGIWKTGRTAAVIINGNLNAAGYLSQVINPVVIPTVQEHDLILQQDNARPHVARIVTEALQQSSVEVLPWPARSPDLSPIEHLWDVIGRRLYHEDQQRPPTDLGSLAHRLVEEWNAIPQDVIQNLINSVPNRLRHCIQRRGGHIIY